MKSYNAFVCPNCRRAAAVTVGGQIGWDGTTEDGDWVGFARTWTLLQCQLCQDPTLMLTEDYEGGPEDEVDMIVYPPPRRANLAIPGPLRVEWEEAQRCLEAHAYAACVVMVGRTLEGTCQDQGVKKKSLAANLRELRRLGLLDDTLMTWADALRVTRNKGAHFTGTPVSREDAVDSLDFAEALLDHIYVFKKRFEQFQKRIGK